MIEEAEKVRQVHIEWMQEHRQAMRRANRRLIGYLVYCSIVTFSSFIFIFNPPHGFAPPADYRFPGEMTYLLVLFGATIVALFGLLAWLEALMRRQAQRAGELIATFFELGQRIGKNSSTSA